MLYTSFIMIKKEVKRQTLELELANIALVKEKEKAESANNAKGQFLANMSHEIRTPLNGLMGTLQLMELSEKDPKNKTLIDIAKQSSELLLHVLNDILDYSKIESAKFSLTLQPTDIVKVTEDVVLLFKSAAQEKKLDMLFTYDSQIQNQYLCDAFRLRQVISNIVGGTGLGLSISKGIVKQMGGTIEAKSTLGVGSTFTLKISLKEVESSSTAVRTTETNEELKNQPVKPITMLVAEDDTVGRLLIQKLAETKGWQVHFAENGEEVIKKLPDLDINIILMDVQMPHLNGFETTIAIRQGIIEGKEDIPIIAMTAFALEGDREKCLACGMNDYISKPIIYHELIKKIEHWNHTMTPQLQSL